MTKLEFYKKLVDLMRDYHKEAMKLYNCDALGEIGIKTYYKVGANLIDDLTDDLDKLKKEYGI